MTKKTIFSILLLLLAMQVLGDNKSKELLNGLSAKLSASRGYQMDFTVSMPGQFSDIKGHMVVSGDKYLIDVQDTELVSDGKVKYTHNRNEREIMIENVDPKDNNILSNPTRFFKLYDVDFNHSYKGSSSVAGENVQVVELTPKVAGSGYNKVVVKLATQTLMLREIRYALEDGEPQMQITVDKVQLNPKIDPSIFTLNRSKYKGVEFIDFR